MDTPKTILVSVAWPYANGEPHVGHVAGVNIPADVFARFHRLIGNRVAMVSGSDMHGTPTMLRALDEGTTPQKVAERYHKVWKKCLKDLRIQYDLYTRTNTRIHAKVTQVIFQSLWRKGYIYEREEDLPFSTSEGIFLPDRLVYGICPECGYEEARGDQCDGCGKTLDPKDLINIRSKRDNSIPEFRKTKHLFLRLTDFKQRLADWLGESGKRDRWRPNTFNQTKAIIDTIQDRAITRDLTWGVRVPSIRRSNEYENKRIYVWFEAVLGYLSATKAWAKNKQSRTARKNKKRIDSSIYTSDRAAREDEGKLPSRWEELIRNKNISEYSLWKELWLNKEAESYYFMGKDNIPFHSVILPAILMGSGQPLNLPTEVVANEFLNIGRKLSKSGGNAVWLREYLANYDPEPLRYYLTSVMPETSDSEFTWEGFLAANNNELVATFGNLVNRTLTLVERHFDNRVPDPGELDDEGRKLLSRTNAELLGGVHTAISNKRFKDGLKAAMELARETNRYLDHRAPWRQVRDDLAGAAVTLFVALNTIANIKAAVYPYLPRTAERLHTMLGLEGTVLEWGWPQSAEAQIPLKAGHQLGKAEILFKKLDESIVAEENAKLGVGDGNH